MPKQEVSMPGQSSRAVRGLISMILILAAAAVFAPAASAVIVKLPRGKMLSYQPTPAKAQALALTHTGAATPRDATFSNLDYGGGPVMSSNTNYVIYWAPSGTQPYPNQYQSGLNQYFMDLAHDSGGNQNTDSVATQFNDSAGDFANYKSHYGGSFVDTHQYPSSGCGPGSVTPGTPCLVDGQLQAELERFISLNGLPRDMQHEYFLVFPPGVQNCFDSDAADGCSADAIAGAYCAYHGADTAQPAHPIIYSNDPYVNDSTCQSGSWPNGPSDGLLDGGLSHEHIESITDPIPNNAWTDFTQGQTTGYEIGDKCAYSEGTALGGSGTTGDPFYNQVINGHHYYYQTEWSNQTSQCLNRFTFSGSYPQATFSSSAPISPATAQTFNATGSTADASGRFHWQFEDPNSQLDPTATELETSTSTTQVPYFYGDTAHHVVSLTVYRNDGTSFATSRVITAGLDGPTAAFTPPGGAVTAGSPATFTNSSSYPSGDSAGTYSWNFGDGSGSTAQSPSHTFASHGTYLVTLTITDAQGQIASSYDWVTVTSPVTAGFSSSPVHPMTGSPVTFDAGSSSGANVYSWNFGDGSATGTGVSPTHTYTSPGDYVVTLTASNGSATDTLQQHVAVTSAPTAVIQQLTSNPVAGTVVGFSGAGSSEPIGNINTYSWDFGDGGTGTGSAPSHEYVAPGTYTVQLTVADNDGHTGTTTQSVVVSSPPAAAFSSSPAAPHVGTTVSFDGSSSTGRSPLSYRWSFGDGATDTTSGAHASHVYGSAATYTASLTVTDAGGHQSTIAHTLTVSSAPAPPPRGIPTAVVSAPSAAVALVAARFSGASSSDSGSSITSYRWSFGDGATSTAVNPAHTYAHPGNYTVALTVTDATGSAATSTTSLRVLRPSIGKIRVKFGRKVERVTIPLTGPGNLRVGKRKTSIKGPGLFTYLLRLNANQRAALTLHRTVHISLAVRFAPASGGFQRQIFHFSVKR